MIASRRGFLLGLGSVMAAPAVIKYSNLMPVRNRLVSYINDDFTIGDYGEIRYIGTSGHKHSVLEFHRWLGDEMDKEQALGGSLLDITSDTPSMRHTDQLITLHEPYYIDNSSAKMLTDGVIKQMDHEHFDGCSIGGWPDTRWEAEIHCPPTKAFGWDEKTSKWIFS
jgi:hypothetical protein